MSQIIAPHMSFATLDDSYYRYLLKLYTVSVIRLYEQFFDSILLFGPSALPKGPMNSVLSVRLSICLSGRP